MLFSCDKLYNNIIIKFLPNTWTCVGLHIFSLFVFFRWKKARFYFQAKGQFIALNSHMSLIIFRRSWCALAWVQSSPSCGGYNCCLIFNWKRGQDKTFNFSNNVDIIFCLPNTLMFNAHLVRTSLTNRIEMGGGGNCIEKHYSKSKPTSTIVSLSYRHNIRRHYFRIWISQQPMTNSSTPSRNRRIQLRSKHI